MAMMDQDGGYVPHAGQELDETAIAKGQGDGDVGSRDTAGVEVDAREDKGGQGKGREAQRGRVGELAVLIGLPQAGLELAAKGWEPGLGSRVDVSERVESPVGGGVVEAVGYGSRRLGRHLLLENGVDGLRHCAFGWMV